MNNRNNFYWCPPNMACKANETSAQGIRPGYIYASNKTRPKGAKELKYCAFAPIGRNTPMQTAPRANALG